MHLNCLNVLLADAAAAPASAPGGASASPTQGLLGSPIIFLGLMLVMMYFVLIRPQQLRAKQQAKLLGALKAGDRVTTASGIVGVVMAVKDKAVPPSVSIRSADAKFEVTKSSVTEILEAGTATES
jgi:preprotein translocase subunit YajC